MRGNELLDKMELIDPAYVEAADAAPERRKSVWSRWGVMAACLCLVVASALEILKIWNTPIPPISDPGTSGIRVPDPPRTGQLEDEPGRNPDLPILSIFENGLGMGYEGYMAYDISELVNANPWNEDSEFFTLPVYQNALTYDENHIPSGADFDKMRAFILDVADRLGLDTNSLTITDNALNEESQQKIVEEFQRAGDTVPKGYFSPTNLVIKAEGIKIDVDQSMTATVFFDPAVSLPAEYNFTHFASYNDKVAAAEYLKTKYGDFIGFDDPQVNIYGGDYNIYNQQYYSIEFFNVNKNKTEQLINYNFNRVTFACDDEGKLFIARIYQPDLSAKAGDYPIISLEQARESLLNGNYITTAPYEIPGAEFIKKAELIYRTGEYEKFFMPYYRFYVELPEDERENGLKTYGAYYVPAVESSYISNMPVWDGRFNY